MCFSFFFWYSWPNESMVLKFTFLRIIVIILSLKSWHVWTCFLTKDGKMKCTYKTDCIYIENKFSKCKPLISLKYNKKVSFSWTIQINIIPGSMFSNVYTRIRLLKYLQPIKIFSLEMNRLQSKLWIAWEIMCLMCLPN